MYVFITTYETLFWAHQINSVELWFTIRTKIVNSHVVVDSINGCWHLTT